MIWTQGGTRLVSCSCIDNKLGLLGGFRHLLGDARTDGNSGSFPFSLATYEATWGAYIDKSSSGVAVGVRATVVVALILTATTFSFLKASR